MLTFAISIVFYLILLLNTEYFVKMFNKDNLEVLEIAKVGFPIFFFSLIFTGINIQFCSLFQSIEYSKIASIINFVRGVILIIILLFTLPTFFGIKGIWSSYVINEMLIAMYIAFYYNKKFKIN